MAITKALRHDPLAAGLFPKDHELSETVTRMIEVVEAVHTDLDCPVRGNRPHLDGAGFERACELSAHVRCHRSNEGIAADTEPVLVVEELQIAGDHHAERFFIARVEG